MRTTNNIHASRERPGFWGMGFISWSYRCGATARACCLCGRDAAFIAAAKRHRSGGV